MAALDAAPGGTGDAMNPPFYIYTLRTEEFGVFYVGGAYGNPNRVNDHGTRSGAKSANRMIRIFEHAGIPVLREIVEVLENKDSVWDAECAWWDRLVADGEPVANDRPNDMGRARRAAVEPGARAKHRATMAVSNRLRAQDPTWRANNAAANKRLAQDPTWRANMARLAQDPTWRANNAAANKRNGAAAGRSRSENPVWHANVVAANQDPTRRAKNRAANFGENSWHARKNGGLSTDPERVAQRECNRRWNAVEAAARDAGWDRGREHQGRGYRAALINFCRDHGIATPATTPRKEAA